MDILAYLGEIPIIQGSHNDAKLAKTPRKQSTPSLITNRPCTTSNKNHNRGRAKSEPAPIRNIEVQQISGLHSRLPCSFSGCHGHGNIT
jgi:hypothetical protein